MPGEPLLNTGTAYIFVVTTRVKPNCRRESQDPWMSVAAMPTTTRSTLAATIAVTSRNSLSSCLDKGYPIFVRASSSRPTTFSGRGA